MMTKHMQATWMRVSAWPMLRWRCTDYGVLRGRTRSAALDRWTTVDPRHRGSRLFSTFLYLSFSLPSIYCSARLSHSVPFCLLYLCSFLAPFLSPLSVPPPPPPTIWVDPRPADNDGRCRGYSAWQSLRHHDSSSSAPLRLSSSSSSFSLSHRVRRVRRPAPLDTWISRRRIS